MQRLGDSDGLGIGGDGGGRDGAVRSAGGGTAEAQRRDLCRLECEGSLERHIPATAGDGGGDGGRRRADGRRTGLVINRSHIRGPPGLYYFSIFLNN